MNAKELAEKVRRIKSPEFPIVMRSTLNQLAEDIATDIEQLIPAYRPPQPSDDGCYCYLEELPGDAPPMLVRIGVIDFDTQSLTYQFWTVAGWREITKGVWPCERPERAS